MPGQAKVHAQRVVFIVKNIFTVHESSIYTATVAQEVDQVYQMIHGSVVRILAPPAHMSKCP